MSLHNDLWSRVRGNARQPLVASSAADPLEAVEEINSRLLGSDCHAPAVHTVLTVGQRQGDKRSIGQTAARREVVSVRPCEANVKNSLKYKGVDHSLVVGAR